MTQEELLQKLADIAHNKDAHEARNDYLLALRAVVEICGRTHDDYAIKPNVILQVIERKLG